MLAMFMAAIEGTIVATAIPSIVGDLGGFSLFQLGIFFLSSGSSCDNPHLWQISDLYGRKPVFTFGIVVFLFGSVLCGFAYSMNLLIFFA